MLVDGDTPNCTSTTPVEISQHPAASAPGRSFEAHQPPPQLHRLILPNVGRHLPKLQLTVHPNIHQTTIISRERCYSPASRVVRRLSRVFLMRVRAVGEGSEVGGWYGGTRVGRGWRGMSRDIQNTSITSYMKPKHSIVHRHRADGSDWDGEVILQSLPGTHHSLLISIRRLLRILPIRCRR